MMNAKHREMDTQADRLFRPKTKLSELECTAWSRSSNTRDPQECEADQQSQGLMLQWLVDDNERLYNGGRCFVNETPHGGNLCENSPLKQNKTKLGVSR
jgi:hypothetical protein